MGLKPPSTPGDVVEVAGGNLAFWLPSWAVLFLAVLLGLAVWPDVLTRDLYHSRSSSHLALDDLRPSREVVRQVCTDYILDSTRHTLDSPGFLDAALLLAADPERQETHHILARRRIACALVMAADQGPLEGPTAATNVTRTVRRWAAWGAHRLRWRAACMEYFRHYLALAARKDLIFFHHVSKSGGTTMCDNAFLNGCRPPATSRTPLEAYEGPNKRFNMTRKFPVRMPSKERDSLERDLRQDQQRADPILDDHRQPPPHPPLRRRLLASHSGQDLTADERDRSNLIENLDNDTHQKPAYQSMTHLSPEQRRIRQLQLHRVPVSGVNCFAYNLLDGYIWRESRQRRKPGSNSTDGEHVDVTCQERKDFSRNFGINFMSNENYLTEPMNETECKKGILSFHILRDPHQRIMSHLHHVLDGFDCKRIPPECIPNFSAKIRTDLCGKKFTFVERWRRVDITCIIEKWFGITNDYFTRTIGGLTSFTRPLNGVTEEDFNQAVSNLLNFDVIIVLGHSMQRSLEKIMLGFPFAMPKASNSREYSTNTLTVEQEKKLFESNRYDRRLFAIGQALNSMDVIVLKAAESFCGETTLRPPFTAVDWRRSHVICQAFSSKPDGPDPAEWAVLKGRYEIQRRFFTIKNRKFHCGCGWAGSKETTQDVKPFLPDLLRVNATQMCPRKGVYL